MFYLPFSNTVGIRLSASESSEGLTTSFSIMDNAYSLLSGPVTVELGPKDPSFEWLLDVSSTDRWYDLSVTIGDGDGNKCFARRFLGRMENGEDGMSDPAMSNAVPGLWATREDGLHPQLPLNTRTIYRLKESKSMSQKHKDATLFWSEVKPF